MMVEKREYWRWWYECCTTVQCQGRSVIVAGPVDEDHDAKSTPHELDRHEASAV